MSAENLPSIQEVADKMAATFTGGTATDPNIPEQGTKGPEAAVEEVKEEPVKAAKPVKEVKVEPKVEAVVKEDDKTASRFAALSRKEREVRERQADFDRRTKEFEARERAVQERDGKITSAKQNPVEALKAMGLSYADITAAMMGNYKAPEEDPVDAKIKPISQRFDKNEVEVSELKQKLNDLQNRLAYEEQQKQYADVMSNIKSAAAADTDKYELINSMGSSAYDLVRDVMIEHFKEYNKMLDYSVACDKVEKYYEDELLSKVSNTKKLRSRVQPEALKASPKPALPKKQQESNTLTNSMATAASANPDIDKMSKEDAIAYLSKKLQFK